MIRWWKNWSNTVSGGTVLKTLIKLRTNSKPNFFSYICNYNRTVNICTARNLTEFQSELDHTRSTSSNQNRIILDLLQFQSELDHTRSTSSNQNRIILDLPVPIRTAWIILIYQFQSELDHTRSTSSNQNWIILIYQFQSELDHTRSTSSIPS